MIAVVILGALMFVIIGLAVASVGTQLHHEARDEFERATAKL